MQNFVPGATAFPQDGQKETFPGDCDGASAGAGAPHLAQNFTPGAKGAPQFLHAFPAGCLICGAEAICGCGTPCGPGTICAGPPTPPILGVT